MSGLTPFQIEVAHLFFSLAEAEGFLLAGGSAMLATGLTSRPTQDLDLFAAPGSVDLVAAAQEFETALHDRGWSSQRIHTSPTFVRMVLSGDEQVLVDLAFDSPASLPTVDTVAGPAFNPEELAGRKVVALFGRAEARDFVDVFVLSQQFDRHLLLRRAAEVDLGFDPSILAQMIRTIARFEDHEFPIERDRVAELRGFFKDWIEELG